MASRCAESLGRGPAPRPGRQGPVVASVGVGFGCGFSSFFRGRLPVEIPREDRFRATEFRERDVSGGSIILVHLDFLTSFRGRPILERAPNRGPLRGPPRPGDCDRHALRIGRGDDLRSRTAMIENKYIIYMRDLSKSSPPPSREGGILHGIRIPRSGGWRQKAPR